MTTSIVETFLRPDAIGALKMSWELRSNTQSRVWDRVKMMIRVTIIELGMEISPDDIESCPLLMERLLNAEDPAIRDFVLNRDLKEKNYRTSDHFLGFSPFFYLDDPLPGEWVMHKEFTQPRGPINYCRENHWGACLVCRGPQGPYLRVPTTKRELKGALWFCEKVLSKKYNACPHIKGDTLVYINQWAKRETYPSEVKEQQRIFQAKMMKIYNQENMRVEEFWRRFEEGSLPNVYLSLSELVKAVNRLNYPEPLDEPHFRQNMAPVSLEERQRLQRKFDSVNHKEETERRISKLREEIKALEFKLSRKGISPSEETWLRERINDVRQRMNSLSSDLIKFNNLDTLDDVFPVLRREKGSPS